MANGEMLAELRAMAQVEKIATPAALRLLISSNIETLQKLTNMEKDQQELRKQLLGSEVDREKDAEAAKDITDGMWREQNGLIQELSNQVKSLSEDMTNDIQELTCRVDKLVEDPETGIKRLFKNPLIVIGFFIQEHPKWALFILVLLLLLFNLWLIDDFRIAVLQWAHVPDFFIKSLNPTPFP